MIDEVVVPAVPNDGEVRVPEQVSRFLEYLFHHNFDFFVKIGLENYTIS